VEKETLLAQLKITAKGIETAMEEEISFIRNPLLAEIITHATFNGGKRIRPVLTIYSAGLINNLETTQLSTENRDLYWLAMVFEYLHAASLLHDDVIDRAEKRRGKASANLIWENTLVILAGDYLHARAMTLAGKYGSGRCLAIIGQATMAMIEAECLQMENSLETKASEDDYFSVLKGKTAALLGSACEVGIEFAGGNSEQCRALQVFGSNLGLSFQIIDDLLDYQGDSNKTGKATGNDLAEGKFTLPLLHAFDLASDNEKQEILDIVGARKKDLINFNKIYKVIEKYNGFATAREKAAQLINIALKQLDIFPDCQEKSMLSGLAYYILSRDK
jgi:octaprenyl-diphosphate synthase